MASIFKRRDKKTAKKSGNWIIEYFDATGRRITKSSKTTDRASAEQIARKWEADVAKRKAGVIDPRLEAFALYANKPLAEHLDALEAAIESQADPDHIRRKRAKINRIVEYCGWSILRDIEPDGVNRFASHLRAEGNAPATIRHYLVAIGHFVNWAYKSGRLQYNVLATIKKPKAEVQQERRALCIDELLWFFATTETEPTRYGLSGKERALVYRVAVMTGLRAGELRKLTRGDFRLTGDRPHIFLSEKKTKNGKKGLQPIASGIVPDLMNHLRTKSGEATVFRLRERTAEMLRADLAAAREAWLATIHDPQERVEADASDYLCCLDADERKVDFHALRTAGISHYADITHPKITQEIARHGNFETTYRHYVRADSDAKQEAVEQLAKLLSGSCLQRATGTIDTAPQHPQHFSQQSPRFPLRLAAMDCDEVEADLGTENGIESPKKMGGSAENPDEDDTICDSYGTVAQRLEQGTHNPLQSQQNTAPDAYPQHFQQQSSQKTPVSEVDKTPNQLASLSSLVHICESLSAKEQEALLQFALSLYRNEVNQ